MVVPAITPIDDREDVDEAAFRKVLRRLIKAGVHGIFVGGSAGEGPLLTDAQWRRMVEIAFDEVKGAIPLLGGAIDTSSRKVCEKVEVLGDDRLPPFCRHADVLCRRQDARGASAAFW